MPLYPYKDLPTTQHSVFYSYAIEIDGHAVGSFEKFSVSFSRTAERIREIYNGRGARTKEMLWSVTDIQVSVDHVEMYHESMLQALGFQLVTIEDLNRTVDIIEVMYLPNEDEPGRNSFAYNSGQNSPDNLNGDFRSISYIDCVATSADKEVNVGSTKVIESMTFECRTVRGTRLPSHDLSTIPTS